MGEGLLNINTITSQVSQLSSQPRPCTPLYKGNRHRHRINSACENLIDGFKLSLHSALVNPFRIAMVSWAFEKRKPTANFSCEVFLFWDPQKNETVKVIIALGGTSCCRRGQTLVVTEDWRVRLARQGSSSFKPFSTILKSQSKLLSDIF